MTEIYGSDAYNPDQIAERVETVGVNKANLPFIKLSALGVLAGGFIGLGAMFFLIVASDPTLSFAVQRVLGGFVFSLGLILVVVAGAELFTGNNLMIMAWVSRKIPLPRLVRNLTIVYFANFFGAAGLALLVSQSGHLEMDNGGIGRTATAIALSKLSLSFPEAFLKGVICNILVCLAVWLAMAGRSVVDRIVGVIFPVSAFVAGGFEHCIANQYFVPLAIFNGSTEVTWTAFLLKNLLPVTLGNLAGGAGMVGFVYWIIYRRNNSNPDG